MIAKVGHFTGTGMLLAAGFSLAGCLKSEQFPDQPVLTFKKLEQRFELNSPNDTQASLFLYVTVGFTDGDGDVGLDETDTQSPFGQNEAHYFNFFCDFKKQINGQWADINSSWSYRMKRISPTGQDPTLNGEIQVRVGPYPGPRGLLDPPIHAGDTLQVNVRLEDRSLHMSNTVTSERFFLQ